MDDEERFRRYLEIADLLTGNSTREQLIELAQVLVIHVEHYRSKFGDLPVEESIRLLELLTVTEGKAKMLGDGLEVLVGTPGILMKEEDDAPSSH